LGAEKNSEKLAIGICVRRLFSRSWNEFYFSGLAIEKTVDFESGVVSGWTLPFIGRV